MKAVKLNGETIEIILGQALCGIDFKSFEMTYEDHIKGVENCGSYERFMEWVQCVLFTRLCQI